MKSIFNKIKTFFRLAAIVAITLEYTVKSYLSMSGKHPSPGRYYQLARQWAGKLLKAAGVRIETIGEEKLNPDMTYIYAANHSSLFDIPAVFAGLKDDVRIIYKKELEKIPAFGAGMRKSPYIGINRDNPREAMKSMEEAIEHIRRGDSVIVFPEGSRSKSGEVQSFKRGAFMLASRSGKPIVPVTVLGASDVMPAGTFNLRGGVIRLIIDDPIELTGQIDKKQEQELMHEVRETIVTTKQTAEMAQ
jgi:1-acyl-sn-glycerol-3-phosphate acyltransferase